MANIGNLVVKLQAQTAAFKKGMADARQSVARFADAARHDSRTVVRIDRSEEPDRPIAVMEREEA